MTGWKPIKTAPKDGTKIIVCGKSYLGEYYIADVKWDDTFGGWVMFSPEEDGYTVECFGHSHWMPWPDPPEDIRQSFETADV